MNQINEKYLDPCPLDSTADERRQIAELVVA
jgi:hypothetical protein